MFRGFFLGELALRDDAVPYYDHIKFFVDNMMRGIVPLWDPTWESGVSNEFFLRRMGEFNPFFFLIVFCNKLGLPHYFSYMAFVVGYYFLGMAGFYKLAKVIFQDKSTAFTAYMLMTFSSFIVLLFNSFIVLVFTPMIWFFYFLILFTRNPHKVSCLGLTFTLMITAVTYLPFYFLTIVLIYLFCFSIIYASDLKNILARCVFFTKENYMFVGICILFLIISLWPGVLYFYDAAAGDFVLPRRHTAALSENSLAVTAQTHVQGGVVLTVILQQVFSNLKNFDLGVFYMPIFTYILFLFGLFTQINKRLILWVTVGMLLYLIGLYEAGPLYQFLYRYIFYFKYFRNFQFFLWLVILPVFILISCEHLAQLMRFRPKNRKEYYSILTCVVVVHMGLLLFLWTQKNIIFSSYVVIVLSAVFFLAYFLEIPKSKPLRMRPVFVWTCLFFLSIIQPVRVYHYLAKNAQNSTGHGRYEQPYQDFSFTRGQPPQEQQQKAISSRMKITAPQVYYTTRWYHFLLQSIRYDIFKNYMHHKWIVYDQVKRVNDQSFLSPSASSPAISSVMKHVQSVFDRKVNVAFISASSPVSPIEGRQGPFQPLAQFVQEDTPNFHVLKCDVNSIKIKTSFNTPKFIVYNDNYHKHWHAFVDGQPSTLWRANIAFKGMWVPAGQHVVFLRYGSGGHYGFKWGMMGLFIFVLGWLIKLFQFNEVNSP